MRLGNGNKRLVASGAMGAILATVVGVGNIWDLDSLWWWDRAVETLALLDGLLGTLGVWGKVSNHLRARAAGLHPPHASIPGSRGGAPVPLDESETPEYPGMP